MFLQKLPNKPSHKCLDALIAITTFKALKNRPANSHLSSHLPSRNEAPRDKPQHSRWKCNRRDPSTPQQHPDPTSPPAADEASGRPKTAKHPPSTQNAAQPCHPSSPEQNDDNPVFRLSAAGHHSSASDDQQTKTEHDDEAQTVGTERWTATPTRLQTSRPPTDTNGPSKPAGETAHGNASDFIAATPKAATSTTRARDLQPIAVTGGTGQAVGTKREPARHNKQLP